MLNSVTYSVRLVSFLWLNLIICSSLHWFQLEEWKSPHGRPQITWMKTVLDDLKSHKLPLSETVDMTQSWPVWRLLAVSDATHSQGTRQK